MKPRHTYLFILILLALGASVIIPQAKGSDSKTFIPPEFLEIWHVAPGVKAHSDSLFGNAIDRFNHGDYAEAARLFAECHRFDSLNLHPDNPQRAYAAQWLGECHRRMGDTALFHRYSDPVNGTPVDRRLTWASDSMSQLALIQPELPEGMRLLSEVEKTERHAVGENHPYYANTMYWLASGYLNYDSIDKALPYARKAAEIRHRWFGDTSRQHIEALALKALIMYRSPDPDTVAASLYENQRIIDMCTAIGDTATAQNSLLGMAYTYNRLDSPDFDLDDRENLLRSAWGCLDQSTLNTQNTVLQCDIFVKLGDVLATRITSCSDTLATDRYVEVWKGANDFFTAATYYGLPDSIWESRSLGLLKAIYQEAHNALEEENYTHALALDQTVLDHINDKTVILPEDSWLFLLDKCRALTGLERYSEAEQPLLDLYQEQASRKSEPAYHHIIENLATCYSATGRHDKSTALRLELHDLLKAYDPYNINMVLPNIFALVLSYEEQEDWGSALHWVNNGIAYCHEYDLETSSIHLAFLDRQIECCIVVSDNKQAMESSLYVLEAIERNQEEIGDEYLAYIIREPINFLTNYYLSQGNTDEAKNIFNRYKPIVSKNPDVYNMLSMSLAVVMFHEKKVDEAMTILDNMKTFATEIDPGLPYYLELIQSIGYAATTDFAEGYAKAREAYQKLTSATSENSIFSFFGSQLISIVASMKNDAPERGRYAIEYSGKIRAYVLNSFLTLSSAKRQALWGQHSRFLMDEFMGYAAADLSAQMRATAYDNLLLGKGLMLNTEREISDIIRETDNQEVQATYQALLTDKQLMEKLQKAANAASAAHTDSLAREIERREYELQKYCGDFTAPLAVTWRDVAHALKPGEAAVEFATYRDSTDTDRYMAMLLKAGDESPRLVSLDDIDALKAWPQSTDKVCDYIESASSALAREIWQPLAREIGDAETVYFSAIGTLHNIPIETLADWEDPGSHVSDRWKIYRLSSTRELALAHKPIPVTNGAIYGGLKYDTSPDILAADAARYEPYVSKSRGIHIDYDSISSTLRAGLDSLPGTRLEAIALYNNMLDKGLAADIFTDTLGTEISFKAQSGQHRDIIHIGTHGFSWNRRTAQRYSFLPFLNIDDNLPASDEDMALSRCGLFFAGAENALRRHAMPDNVDDGILTAKEIARLDLRGLGLAVMSACESGLGDITGDGVFGLQRGFKKAGARSILMTLWKVDDQATNLLIDKFYEHLLSDHTKHQALAAAQRFLREYTPATAPGHAAGLSPDSGPTAAHLTPTQRRRLEKQLPPSEPRDTGTLHPYAHPRFWSGFILLDAID